ncbi:MAG: hypothetical protein FWF87_04720 [Synergistaceae bacterium]|nr:hypothetical protein [Synergistaceae bacterium]
MMYANNIKDIANAFNPSPLKGEQLKEFYCDETMKYRTGDEFSSPTDNILEACKMPSDKNVFLLMGHEGCGKSTELNEMSSKLVKEGYKVSTVLCKENLDLINIVYTDLLILMGEALVRIANEVGCKLDGKTIEELLSFWPIEKERVTTSEKSSELSAGAEAQIGAPSFFTRILNLSWSSKAELRYNTIRRDESREKMKQSASDWLSMLNTIADSVTEKMEGKQPILIFEDLDKITNLDVIYEIFCNYATTMSGVSFPVIYTFPIEFSYSPRFASLYGYYVPNTLPMIKLKSIDDKLFKAGVDVVMKIISKRVELSLFDKNVLKKLIVKTGGSLRDLFSSIITSAKRANRRKSPTISMEDANQALMELKSSLTRRIEEKHYNFLKKICKGERQRIENKEMLLELLQAHAVLEYNSKRWHDVHPLVRDFLDEQGLLNSEQQ